MFCNQCGTQLQPEFNVCPKCGRALNVATPATVISYRDRLERHLRILGILWIVLGALFLLPSLFLMGIGGIARVAIPFEPGLARTLGPFVLFMMGGTLLILGAGGILVGWGLMQHHSWARIAAIVLGVLALFHPPFGTALGIYTLWVLLSGDAGNEYQRMASTA
ncbi:MAG TPA: zinc ribbon domain-containing protein [Terriglobales bacterium]|nr:zinc ribbon domain-containing protein [Terriglobales bacterium]